MDLNLSKNFNVNVAPRVKPQHYSMIELVSLVVIIILFTWFLLLPKRSELISQQATLAQLQAQQSKIDGTLSALTSLEKQLKSKPDEVGYLDQAIPLQGNSIELQLLIEALAKSIGVTVGDISLSASPGDVNAGDQALLSDPYAATRSLKQITGSVYVVGNLTQLQAFLQKVQSSGTIMNISEVSIAPAANNNLGLKFSLAAYYLAP